MGWFRYIQFSKHSSRNFRPRLGMGWFLKLKLKVFISGSQIFVPEWGWVGSVDNSNGFGDGTLFSSPSGDGLVLNTVMLLLWPQIKIFVPEWGWVGSAVMAVWGAEPTFSSPLGDGLVLDFGETIEEIFVFSSPFGDGLVHEDGDLLCSVA